MRSLHQKVVVITGAASGIGEALARNLAQRGACVALVDQQEKSLNAVVSELCERGYRASAHLADVGDSTRVSQLPDEVIDLYGHIDILINNAGVSVGDLFEDHSIEDAQWLLRVNLMGVIYTCDSFLPHLKTRPRAHIVNLSSMFGLFGMPGQAVYSASKAAIAAFTEALNCELAGTSVRLTTVYPGTIKSNLIASSRMTDAGTQAKATSMQQRHGMPTERAAEKIVRGIEKDKSRLLIGADAHLVNILKRIMPAGFQRLASWLFSRI